MLTPKLRVVLNIIVGHIREYGVAPTFQEIADAQGISSKSGVARSLAALEERGHIRRLHGRSRGIEVIRRRGISPAIHAVLDRLEARIAADDDGRPVEQILWEAEAAVNVAVDFDEVVEAAAMVLALVETMARRGIAAAGCS